MTHQRKHTIGDTPVIPNNSLRTFWCYKPKTDSNISVDEGYRDGVHLPEQEGDHTDHVRHDDLLVHL